MMGRIPRPKTDNDLIKKALTEYFGFEEKNACDEFARKFGGITRKQFIELAKKRLKKIK